MLEGTGEGRQRTTKEMMQSFNSGFMPAMTLQVDRERGGGGGCKNICDPIMYDEDQKKGLRNRRDSRAVSRVTATGHHFHHYCVSVVLTLWQFHFILMQTIISLSFCCCFFLVASQVHLFGTHLANRSLRYCLWLRLVWFCRFRCSIEKVKQ